MSATLCEPDLLGIETDEATEAIWGEENDRSIVAREVDGADDVPDERWSTGELTARAAAESERIGHAEKWVTPHHWYLGEALIAVRKRFKRVEWGNWLVQCKVSKSLARDARKLAKLYETPEALGDVSVREALRRAKADATDPETSRLLRNLEVRFRKAVKAARAVGEKVRTPAERAALARSIEQTGAALSALPLERGQGGCS